MAEKPRRNTGSGDNAMTSKPPFATQSGPIVTRWIPLIAAILLFGIQAWHWRAFTHDDAWISFRYAENFVTGHGLVFNPGEKVEGYTNFLWTLLMSIPIALDLDPVPVSKLLGVVFSLGTLFVFFRFCSLLLSSHVFPYPAAAVCLLAASAPFAFWSIGGMETSMFGFLTLLGLYLTYCYICAENAPAPAGPNPRQTNLPTPVDTRFIALSAGLILTLNMMTRPDGLVIWGITLLYCAFFLRLYRAKSFYFWLSPFLFVYVPYFLWRWNYYGWLLPNTYYVRMGTNLAQSQELAGAGFKYVTGFFLVHGNWPVVILFLAGLAAARFRGKWFLVALMAVWAVHLIHAGGDEKPFGRLILPLLPVYILLLTAGIASLCARIPRNRISICALFLFAVSAIFLLNGFRNDSDRVYVKHHIFQYCLRSRQTGEWIHANAKPGETMAARAIGALGYYGKIPCFDLLGIVDEHIAHLPLEPGQLTAHGKSDLIHILRKNPTYVVFMLIEPEKLGYRRLYIKPDKSASIMIFKHDPSLTPDEEYMANPRENQGLLLPHVPGDKNRTGTGQPVHSAD
jgi:arabinofuranosyltransferase